MSKSLLSVEKIGTLVTDASKVFERKDMALERLLHLSSEATGTSVGAIFAITLGEPVLAAGQDPQELKDKSRQALVQWTPNVSGDGELPLHPTSTRQTSELAVAKVLVSEGTPVGVWTVLLPDAGDMEKWRSISDALAPLMALALNQRSWHDAVKAANSQVERRIREVAAVYEIGRLIDHMDTQRLFQAITERAAAVMDAQACSIMIKEAETNSLVIAASYGLPHEVVENTRILVGEAISGRVAATGEPLLLHSLSDAPIFDGKSVQGVPGVSSSICMPMKDAAGDVLGVLCIRRGAQAQPFNEIDLRLFGVFATHATFSVINARLFAAAQQELAERRRAEAALLEAKDAADVANRAKSLFLANMSHELRTPLNSVIGYSEMLQEEAEDLELEGFIPDLRKIHGAAKHLLSLINDVLDLSKIEAGKMEIHIEDIAIGKLVTDVVATIDPMMMKNNIKFNVDCPEDIGNMRADSVKLRQGLLNLLSNASKFTNGGTVTLRVARERAEKRRWEGDWIVMSVSDMGIGMTEVQMSKLFDAFSQADNSTSKKFGGTGLGLALTQRFCRLMGGDVQVTSTVGKGSTFTMRLPANVVTEGGDSIALAEHNGHTPQSKLVSGQPGDTPYMQANKGDLTVPAGIDRS